MRSINNSFFSNSIAFSNFFRGSIVQVSRNFNNFIFSIDG
jgi:hypothetical protein